MSNAQVARKRYTQQQFETPFNVDAVDFQHDSKETILEHCRFVSQSTKVALPGNIFDQVHAAAKNFIKRLAREFDFSSLTTKQALEIAELFRYEKVVLSAIIKSSADIPLNATQLVAICKNQCNNTLGGRPIYHFYEGQWPVWKQLSALFRQKPALPEKKMNLSSGSTKSPILRLLLALLPRTW